MQKKRIVIVGAGFAGAYCAQELDRKLDTDQYEVVLIDQNNYFAFYPLLVEAGSGGLEPRHTIISIRRFVEHSIFIMAKVSTIDFMRQTVSYTIEVTGDQEKLRYDHLVVALGSVTRFPPIPGLKEYGHELKSLGDAIRFRDHGIRMLEAADAAPHPEEHPDLLTFVVVGANFTGVEAVGEFQISLKEAVREYPNLSTKDLSFHLVEIAPRILPALDDELANYAHEKLVDRGIKIHLNTATTRLGEDYLEFGDGTRLNTRTVLWAAGIQPNPLLENLDLPKDKRGYVLCERDLRVRGFRNVWGIGDCAVNEGADGKAYPATAQHAMGEGKWAARNIINALHGLPTRPCNLTSKGSLAALGCRTAVAKVFGLNLSGFWAWFVYRSVYLLRMPGFARKVRLALDWTTGLFFKRDVVQLGIYRKTQDFEVASSEKASA